MGRAHREGENLCCTFCVPPRQHHPHSPCFLLSLTKTRKGSSRESPLSHLATARVAMRAKGRVGSQKPALLSALHPPQLVWPHPCCLGKWHLKDRVYLVFLRRTHPFSII